MARAAEALDGVLGLQAELVRAAAWLHDVGYTPALSATGFHPLDGARYLREEGIGNRTVWLLVANHSCALIEAGERGLAEVLEREFPVAGEHERFLLAALTYCDMTTGPSGEPMTLDERLTEAMGRYGPDDVVSRALGKAEPLLRAQCDLVAAALAAQ